MFIVLITLSVVMFLPLVLAIGSIKYRTAQFGKPDIDYPRDQASKLTGAGKRIVAAQENAWEALGLFITALVICALAEVDFNQLKNPSLLFVGARISHALFYLVGNGNLRFLAFVTSLISLTWMIYLAFSAL